MFFGSLGDFRKCTGFRGLIPVVVVARRDGDLPSERVVVTHAQAPANVLCSTNGFQLLVIDVAPAHQKALNVSAGTPRSEPGVDRVRIRLLDGWVPPQDKE